MEKHLRIGVGDNIRSITILDAFGKSAIEIEVDGCEVHVHRILSQRRERSDKGKAHKPRGYNEGVRVCAGIIDEYRGSMVNVYSGIEKTSYEIAKILRGLAIDGKTL